MSKVHVGRSDGGRWVEDLDRKELGHTDLGKKEGSLGHVAGFQKGPWQKKKNIWGLQIESLVVGLFSGLSSSYPG